MGSDMQGNVVLLALDEVKAGDMPEEQKKPWFRGSPRTMPRLLSKR
jgi:peptidyl-prolyl cis-trans isomerase D